MTKRTIAMLVAASMLGSCGGGDGGGAAAPPTTSPSPAPSPSPSSSPSSVSYPTYAQLTGDQTFRTACAALRFDSTPYQSIPATPFGNGVTLSYSAASDGHAIASDGQIPIGAGLTFTAADRDPNAPATVRGYRRTVNGFVETLSLGVLTPGGATPDYVRGFGFRASVNGEPRQGAPAVQGSCIFGVPTLVSDPPQATQVVFTRIGINGAGYVTGGSGAPEAYSLAPSTATLSVDLVGGRVTTTVRLVGILQTASGPAASTTDLGTYSGTVGIDPRGFYAGSLERTDAGVLRAATFGGWFFGPQAREAAFAISLAGQAGTTARELTAIVNVIALR